MLTIKLQILRGILFHWQLIDHQIAIDKPLPYFAINLYLAVVSQGHQMDTKCRMDDWTIVA